MNSVLGGGTVNCVGELCVSGKCELCVGGIVC